MTNEILKFCKTQVSICSITFVSFKYRIINFIQLFIIINIRYINYFLYFLFIRNPPLEDILNNTFIDEERLEKESVMHRIMTGNFNDPFKNMEDDYKNVKTDLMKDMHSDMDEENKDDNTKTTEEGKKIQPNQEDRSYVPGIVRVLFQFPRMSKLNKEQQAMCLRVLLRFSESNKPKITQAEREELQTYMVNKNTLLLRYYDPYF